jgi:hypothetical protein
MLDSSTENNKLHWKGSFSCKPISSIECKSAAVSWNALHLVNKEGKCSVFIPGQDSFRELNAAEKTQFNEVFAGENHVLAINSMCT